MGVKPIHLRFQFGQGGDPCLRHQPTDLGGHPVLGLRRCVCRQHEQRHYYNCVCCFLLCHADYLSRAAVLAAALAAAPIAAALAAAALAAALAAAPIAVAVAKTLRLRFRA